MRKVRNLELMEYMKMKKKDPTIAEPNMSLMYVQYVYFITFATVLNPIRIFSCYNKCCKPSNRFCSKQWLFAKNTCPTQHFGPVKNMNILKFAEKPTKFEVDPPFANFFYS